jgi:hypothetical protein
VFPGIFHISLIQEELVLSLQIDKSQTYDNDHKYTETAEIVKPVVIAL